MQASAQAEERSGDEKDSGSQIMLLEQQQKPVLLKMAGSLEDIQKAVSDFQELKNKIILSNPQNYHKFASKSGAPEKIALTRSGLRLVQMAFGISDRIVKEERLTLEGVPNVYGWKIWVEAYLPGVKSVIGVAMCWSNEPNKFFPHGEHDVYSTAHTRAKNRAVSDFTGAGEPSAEELEGAEAERAFANAGNQSAAAASAASTSGGNKGTMDEFKTFGPGPSVRKT